MGNKENNLKTNMANSLGVGERIRILRSVQNRTLQEVADKCGLSKSMISKIENDKTIPSVATLVKIAQTLGTNISQLLEQNSWDRAVVTTLEEAEKKLVKTEKGYHIFPYASVYHEKKCDLFYL